MRTKRTARPKFGWNFLQHINELNNIGLEYPIRVAAQCFNEIANKIIFVTNYIMDENPKLTLLFSQAVSLD